MFGTFDKHQFTLRIFQDHTLWKQAYILTEYVVYPSLYAATSITIKSEATTTKKNTLFPDPVYIFSFFSIFFPESMGL